MQSSKPRKSLEEQRKARKRKKRLIAGFFCSLILVLVLFISPANIERDQIAEALQQKPAEPSQFKSSLKLNIDSESYTAFPTVMPKLQKRLEKIYRRYKPMYAAFVAIDPEDGKVLAMTDYSDQGQLQNLSTQASFPAASVFKLITSAAVLEENKLDPNSKIPFNGSFTSLYRRNLTYNITRWTRFIRLDDALAKSLNSVFGKIAIHGLGRNTLQKYANAFGFNNDIEFDLPVEKSTVVIPEDHVGIAESGSGYTKKQTLSPLQGAMIAASIINKGKMLNPFIIEKIEDQKGKVVYKSEPKLFSQPIDPNTASKLAQMMEKTITRGTARRHYRDYHRNKILKKLFIGAKTGSLTGNNPKGKYDWFVGFAQSKENPNKKFAFASMIINGKFWRVKSTYIARQAILEYFKEI